MTVVTIIGILASTAIPSFIKYIKKSKTTEAMFNIRKIYDGEVAYFQNDFVQRNGLLISRQFALAGPEPTAVPRGQKVAGNWESAGWTLLSFGVDSPVLYRYTAQSGGIGTRASFTARAEGDIDSDGVLSLFERIGAIDSFGNVVGGAAVYTDRETE
jgi:type II secretory pathway pseudopilin PulG